MIEIKHRLTGEVIYTHGGNILTGEDLRYSDLRGEDLLYADLRGANLRGANL